MSLFDILTKHNTLEDVTACRNAGGVVIDVRTRDEYAAGHIPGSINIPVDRIGDACERIKKKDTPICVYCLSGARAKAATGKLKAMGYSDIVVPLSRPFIEQI